MERWVTLAEFSEELEGFRAEVTLRKLAQNGLLEARKQGKTWLVNAESPRAKVLKNEAMKQKKAEEWEAKRKAEEWSLRTTAEQASGRIAELEETIAGRNARIAEQEKAIATYESRIAELEQALAVEQARVQAFREVLGAKPLPAPVKPSEAPSAGELATRWEEGSWPTYKAFAEELGLPVELVRSEVRKEQARRKRQAEKAKKQEA